jgi:hypothetical protein
MSGLNPADLDPNQTNTVGFNPYSQKGFGAGTSIKTVDLSLANGGNIGNALLFAARAKPGTQGDNDHFKIDSLTVTTVVPVPAAAWLFGSGLLGLVGVARRKAA